MTMQTIDVDGEILFERRIDNWRRTVLFMGGGRGCSSWAALYIKFRDGGSGGSTITVEELDGWLVEEAWKSMIHFDEKQVLRYWFIYRYPEHWIKRKLGLRRVGVPLLLAKAKMNLKKELDKLFEKNKNHDLEFTCRRSVPLR